MLVPKDKRQEIAKFVEEHPIKDYDDLVGFSCKIMAALVEGRITPVIAQELRAWHELNFTIMATKNSAEGNPQDAYTDIVTALVQVKRETKQLRGDYFDANELVEKREPVMVEAKNGGE
tara:strand:- start:323 stop:679 length:357 start_codon:yes stop_codon:yes gene_type:complete